MCVTGVCKLLPSYNGVGRATAVIEAAVAVLGSLT
jgi:hypothetical protein